MDVAKAAAAIVFLSLIAANWLSVEVDKDKLAKLAAFVSRDKSDPVTTGSVAKRADAVRLDPCTGARRN